MSSHSRSLGLCGARSIVIVVRDGMMRKSCTLVVVTHGGPELREIRSRVHSTSIIGQINEKGEGKSKVWFIIQGVGVGNAKSTVKKR